VPSPSLHRVAVTGLMRHCRAHRVRIRITCSSGWTKIFPSPLRRYVPKKIALMGRLDKRLRARHLDLHLLPTRGRSRSRDSGSTDFLLAAMPAMSTDC